MIKTPNSIFHLENKSKNKYYFDIIQIKLYNKSLNFFLKIA